MNAKEIEKREIFIDQAKEKLQKKVRKIQKELSNTILSRIISDLDTVGGILSNSTSNISITSRLERVYRSFNDEKHTRVALSMIRDMERIGKINRGYFSSGVDDREALITAEKQAKSIVNRALGVKESGEMVSNGYMRRFIDNDDLFFEIQSSLTDSVASSSSLVDATKKIKTIIEGSPNVSGGLEAHYRRFAYDTYQQVDRINQSVYSTSLGLSAFIYGGTRTSDSRPFCAGGRDKTAGITFRRKKGEVFLLEEAQGWSNLRRFQGKPKSYTPIIDLGGHGCVDSANFITDRVAMRRRSDLFLDDDGVLRAKNFRKHTW